MKKVLYIFLVVITSFYCLAACVQITVNPKEEKTPVEESELEESLEKIPEPNNGYIFDEISIVDGTAPLTIETIGTGGYYLVLDPITLFYEGDDSFNQTRTEMNAKYSYTKFYIRAGSTVDINVPLGEYRIYYATGESWYGEDDLFGEETVYAKCDDTFVFTESQGWTLQLYPVTYGNLDTDTISKKEFPH